MSRLHVAPPPLGPGGPPISPPPHLGPGGPPISPPPHLALALALLLLLPAALLPATASAWQPLTSCGGGNYSAWPAGNPHTTWHYSTPYPSTDLPLATVLSVFEDSFVEWGTPGCSAFDVDRGPDTTQDPMGWSSSEATGFYENTFPASLGSGTLAVTFPSWDNGCALYNANMVVNGYDHTWGTSGNGNDLQSVVTHEFGHWLGLDHSNYSASTMTAYYTGGTGDRTLSCDDTDAVCTLYPSGGTSCDTSDDCSCGVTCQGGWCGGVVVGDDDDDDDDDDGAPGGSCAGPLESVSEQEPNNSHSTGVFQSISSSGGDLTISGDIWCGNNGQDWTGDVDWFVIDVPCADSVRFTADWSGGLGSDLDFYVYDGSNQEITHNIDEDYFGPASADGYAANQIKAVVLCWSGPPVSYTFEVDWYPFGPGDFGDDDDDDDDDDDGAPDDDDATTPPPANDDDAADDDDAANDDDANDDDSASPSGSDDGVRDFVSDCGCAVTEPSAPPAALLLLLLAPLRRRRR